MAPERRRLGDSLRQFVDASPLSRRLDVTYASNRFAVFWTLLSVVTVAAANVAAGSAAGEATAEAVTVALGVFLAWALGRELDPDHAATARWAGLAALPLAAVLGPPALLATAVVMVMARVLVRTSGLRPRGLDLAVVVVGAIVASHTLAGAVAALVLATALVADLRMDDPAPTGPTAAAAIDIILGGALVLVLTDPAPWNPPGAAELWIGALVLLGLIPGPTSPLRSVGDQTRRLLDPRRLATARRLALVVVPVAVIMGGEHEVARLSPVVAAVAALGINNTRRHARARRSPDWTRPRDHL